MSGSSGWSGGPHQQQGVMAEGGEGRRNNGGARGGGKTASAMDDNEGNGMVEDCTNANKGGEYSFVCSVPFGTTLHMINSGGIATSGGRIVAGLNLYALILCGTMEWC